MTLLACFLSVVYGWGTHGHAIVAEIAEQLLENNTRIRVHEILTNRSMAQVSDWADEFRHTHGGEWSGKLHFADLPDRQCKFEKNRDCPTDECVVGAITNYTNRLREGISKTSNEEALKFLIHFVGDAHQPLHAGNIGDKGGNDILVHVNFLKNKDSLLLKSENLHSVWDTVLLKEDEQESDHSCLDSWQEKAAELVGKLGNQLAAQRKHWISSCVESDTIEETCPNVIVTESAQIACAAAYSNVDDNWITSGDKLERGYYETRVDQVEQRLAAAGVRLALLIEYAFALNDQVTKFTI